MESMWLLGHHGCHRERIHKHMGKHVLAGERKRERERESLPLLSLDYILGLKRTRNLFKLTNQLASLLRTGIHFYSFLLPLLPQPRQQLIYFLSINLPILNISYEWNYIMCGLCIWFLSLSINVFKVHPCCGMCQYFISFYG